MKQPSIAASRSARRILIVEDSDTSRDALAHFLELKGFQVCSAQDGLEGLQAAGKFRPDIVFLDLFMPRMDGFELCTRLRAMEQTANAAVFAVTGRMAAGVRHGRSRRCAFDAYLPKPVDFETVELLIKTIMH